MPRGRHSSLTIQLTAHERQTLERWQRSSTIHATRARRGRMLLLLAARCRLRNCHDRGLHPPLYLQVGAAFSRRGLGRLGRQTPGCGTRGPAEGPAEGERVSADALHMGVHRAQRACCMDTALLTRSYQSMVLVVYKLKLAIERGTKPDALDHKPYHRTNTLKAATVNARRA